MAVKFQENGAKKETAKDYKSCEHVPFIPASGEILDSVSVMPLHISLGTGLQFLNITEKIVISLDIEVRQENGLASEGITEAYKKEHNLVMETEVLSEQIKQTISEISFLEESKDDLNRSNPQHFEKGNGKPCQKIKQPSLLASNTIS